MARKKRSLKRLCCGGQLNCPCILLPSSHSLRSPIKLCVCIIKCWTSWLVPCRLHHSISPHWFILCQALFRSLMCIDSYHYLAQFEVSAVCSNDVYDFDTGADTDKQESVVNIVGSRRLTHAAANTSLVLGILGFIWASAETGDIRFILLVTCAILCGYVYQCPPLRLSYQGLGEPLCFAAFGPFATTAFYFSNSSKNSPSGISLLPLSRTIVSASVLVGLTTTLILFCSHFHQIDGDREVGKLSPLVRIGTEEGSQVVRLGITMLYLLLFGFSLCKSLPPTCTVICGLTLPMGKLVVDFVEQNYNDKVKIFMAKYYCVRLHTLFGAALAIGLVLARNGTKTWFPLAS